MSATDLLLDSPDATAQPIAPGEIAARSPLQLFWRRFRRDRVAMAALVFIAILVLVAILAPLVIKIAGTPKPNLQNPNLLDDFGQPSGPSSADPFGTDARGRDVFSRVIYGARPSLEVAFIATAIAIVVGVVAGLLAGYYRGWVDSVIGRLTDLALLMPTFLIAAVLARRTFSTASIAQGNASSNWLQVAIILGLTNWMTVSRTIRGMVLSLREKEFVEAARALGGGPFRVIFRHILPNTMDVVIVNATVAVAQAVLLEAALSFVGLGVKYPDTSLGLLINENQNELQIHPWLFYFPFLFIVLISLSVNFVGDGLRDAFDPRQKRVRA